MSLVMTHLLGERCTSHSLPDTVQVPLRIERTSPRSEGKPGLNAPLTIS